MFVRDFSITVRGRWGAESQSGEGRRPKHIREDIVLLVRGFLAVEGANSTPCPRAPGTLAAPLR